MKTKKLGIAVWVLGAALLVPAAGSAQTLEKIAHANRITVSYREASVPFSYLAAPGQPVGFAVDIEDAIVDAVKAKLHRPKLEVVRIPVTGQNRIPLLKDGGYDLECGSTTNTAARGKEVSFAISHFYAGTRVLVRRDAGVGDYADLAKKPVAVVTGSSNEKVFRKYAADKGLDVEFVPTKDYADGFRLVEEGRAVGFALDDVLLYGLAANSAKPSAYAVIGETLQVEPYGCMVRKDDPAFKKLVDDTIAGLMQSGRFAALYVKWFESPIPPKGVMLDMPMGEALRANMKAMSDQPAY